MRNLTKNFIVFIIAFLSIMGLFTLYQSPTAKPTKVDTTTLIRQINNGEVKKILVDGARIHVTLQNDEREQTQKEIAESFSTLLSNYQVAPDKLEKVEIQIKDNSASIFFFQQVLPFLVPLIIIGAIIYFMMRQVQGTNNRAMMFGQSQVKEADPRAAKNKTTFQDVAGNDEAKEELEEVVEFLKSPKKFLAMGAKIPRGVLLVGAPGTGKTLMARAVAGEADVPFFHMSGSEFVEMFVGVGASRVRDLFRRAKKSAPCIVFVDEIDAVGRQRGAGLGGSHDEREQTLNQILVEMDGFEKETQIILLAATNRPDILDPALLRPGRFDRRVMIDIPDLREREAILKVHARSKPFTKEVNLKTVAQRTTGFTGADLESLLNEAAILAARRNKKKITMDECLESIDKVLLGPERKNRVMSDREKQITAYHEAGHALVAHMLPHADPVHKISIISRGRAGGYTLKLPEEDKHIHSKREFEADIAVGLGGMVAEKLIFDEVTTGPSNDLQNATKLTRQLVTKYGMSDKLGPRTFNDREELPFLGREIAEQRNYGDKIADLIDSEVSKFLEKGYTTAEEVITKHRDKLDLIAKRLIEKETIEREEFEALMAGKELPHDEPPARTPEAPTAPTSTPTETPEPESKSKTRIAPQPA